MPQIPPTVEDAVMRTLAKDPLQRFVSVADFASVLGDALFATQPPLLSGSVERGLQNQIARPDGEVPLVSVPAPSEQEHSSYTTPLHLQTVYSVSPPPTTQSHPVLKQPKYSLAQTNRRVSVQEQNRERMLQRLWRTYEELFA